ncbi:MAG: hypothetical protein WCF85_03580 [Rhodospirillaceae bacterium]
MANHEIVLEDWIFVAFNEGRHLLGRSPNDNCYRLTSQIVSLDGSYPPKWVETKTGTHYILGCRAFYFNLKAEAALFRTFREWGVPIEKFIEIVRATNSAIAKMNAEETIQVVTLSATEWTIN